MISAKDAREKAILADESMLNKELALVEQVINSSSANGLTTCLINSIPLSPRCLETLRYHGYKIETLPMIEHDRDVGTEYLISW